MSLIKTESELENIRTAGAIQQKVMASLIRKTKAGITPRELDKLAEDMIKYLGGEPAFKNYQPEGTQKAYPSTICASVNDVIVHNIPDKEPLKSGDIFKIDIGVRFRDFNTDSAVTIIIDKPKNPLVVALVKATRKSLELGIASAKEGNTLGDIGHAIESHIKKMGFHIVKGLSGHGIGRKVHEEPHVFNFGKPGTGMKLVPGMVIAIEPMVAIGTPELVQTPNEAYASKDGSLTAHFEHTVIITPDGPEVVT